MNNFQHTDCCNYIDPGKKRLTSDSWIIDIGASSHISNSLKNFTNIRRISNWNVLLPNNLKLQATHIGDLYFNYDFVLFDVLYVPCFQYNLLSVTKLSVSLKCEVVFTAENV